MTYHYIYQMDLSLCDAFVSGDIDLALRALCSFCPGFDPETYALRGFPFPAMLVFSNKKIDVSFCLIAIQSRTLRYIKYIHSIK